MNDTDAWFSWTFIVFIFTILFCFCTVNILTPDFYTRTEKTYPNFAPVTDITNELVNECHVRGTNREEYISDLEWCLSQFREK